MCLRKIHLIFIVTLFLMTFKEYVMGPGGNKTSIDML